MGVSTEPIELFTPKFYSQFFKDNSKKTILHPKYMLDCVYLWPETSGKIGYILSRIYMISLFLMEIGHTSYLIINFSNLGEMASTGTTVFSTLQALMKTSAMVSHRQKLKEILNEIWFNFWPVDLITDEKVKREVNNRSVFIIVNMYIYMSLAYFSVYLFLAFDMVLSTQQLPLSSWFPFAWNESPLYEILYVWQWLTNMYVICILTSFDYVFLALVSCCSAQFQVLQEVLRNIFDDDNNESRDVIIKRLGFDLDRGRPTTRELFMKCYKQHKRLIMVCVKLQEVFTALIFLQFFSSTLSICVSSFVLKVYPEKFTLMGTYVVAHIMQLFMYCCIGNELILQSVGLSDAAFYCGWHLKNNKNFTKGLIRLIQRSHRSQQLTALGFTELSYSSFISVCKLSFSFYTVLDSLLKKRNF